MLPAERALSRPSHAAERRDYRSASLTASRAGAPYAAVPPRGTMPYAARRARGAPLVVGAARLGWPSSWRGELDRVDACGVALSQMQRLSCLYGVWVAKAPWA
jgi:hypothetical protein